MKPTLFFVGPTDQAISEGKLVKKAKVQDKTVISVTGCLPLSQLIRQDKQILKNSQVVILGKHTQINFPKTTKINVFNLIADADAASLSLKEVEKFCQHSSVNKVLNAPAQIANSKRHNAQYLFANIRGLNVPKTRVGKVSSAQELEALIDKSALKLPLIVRPAGYHNGENMHLINSLDEIFQLPSTIFVKNRKLTLIEYYGKSDNDDFFNKKRIVFINGQVYPRHAIYSDAWCVHAKDRERIMLNNASLREREKHFLENFESEVGEHRLSILKEMQKRMQLDVWGMDCSFIDDDKILLYEANACMDFFDQDYGPNNEFAYIRPFETAIKRAIKRMIVQA